MKKLILSAVFALACFTAQAKSEVISNGDKNPRSKTKVVVKIQGEAKIPNLQRCRRQAVMSGSCGVSSVVSISETGDCAAAALALFYAEYYYNRMCAGLLG